MPIPRDDAEDSPMPVSRNDRNDRDISVDYPAPVDRPLETDERVIAIDLRTKDLAGEVARLSYKLGALDHRMTDMQAKLLKALGTLTDKINATAPHREKLDTLSEMAIESAIQASQAAARDAAHEDRLAQHELNIAQIRKAAGAGSVVTVVGIAVGTILFKILAARYGIPLP
jgi:hypothetical protein